MREETETREDIATWIGGFEFPFRTGWSFTTAGKSAIASRR
ncbi:MAG: hypothetical protein ACLS5Z_06950 [Clostridium fessum]